MRLILRSKWSWVAAILIAVAAAIFFFFIYNPMRSLGSLHKLETGLFTMTYYGSYDLLPKTVEEQRKAMEFMGLSYPGQPGNCSIFVARGDRQQVLFGRNYDWDQNPALVLFTDPPDGYASIALVDINFLGYSLEDDLTNLPAMWLMPLLAAPLIVMDGMNEYGLSVGVAMVPDERFPVEAGKLTIDGAMARRLVLDHARNIPEALSVLAEYNIDNSDGSFHLLMGDRSGKSVAVEFQDGELRVVSADDWPWQSITNFNLSRGAELYTLDNDFVGLARYQMMEEMLQLAQGKVTMPQAMAILNSVRQEPGTIWSSVYNLSSGEVQLVRFRHYDQVYTFHLPLR